MVSAVQGFQATTREVLPPARFQSGGDILNKDKRNMSRIAPGKHVHKTAPWSNCAHLFWHQDMSESTESVPQ